MSALTELHLVRRTLPVESAPEPAPMPSWGRDVSRRAATGTIARAPSEALGRWRRVSSWWIFPREELARRCPETADFIDGLREYKGNAG